MQIQSIAVDIETLGTPENSGMYQVIPNLAMVFVPEDFRNGIEGYIYTRIPVQEQLNAGCTVDARGLAFWMGMGSYEDGKHEGSQKEVIKALKADVQNTFYQCPAELCDLIDSYGGMLTPEILRTIFEPDFYGVREVHFYGKGCNFDYSLLQGNMYKRFGTGNISSYRAPQNCRTLEALLTKEEMEQAREDILPVLNDFIHNTMNANPDIGDLVLHHPLYDAAREALLISWMLAKKRS